MALVIYKQMLKKLSANWRFMYTLYIKENAYIVGMHMYICYFN
jgi:hypothetical protein